MDPGLLLDGLLEGWPGTYKYKSFANDADNGCYAVSFFADVSTKAEVRFSPEMRHNLNS